MLKIETVTKPIEIEINGLVFSISKSDEMVVKLDKIEKDLKEKAEKNINDNTVETLGVLRETVINAYEELLGKGTFKKIEDSLSEVKGEYTFQMVNCFFKIFEYVTNETVEEMDVSRYDKADSKSNR